MTLGLQFINDGKNPSFASLNNKTITIDDWEFSSMSELCPAFDERKAKTNGHICILVSESVDEQTLNQELMRHGVASGMHTDSSIV